MSNESVHAGRHANGECANSVVNFIVLGHARCGSNLLGRSLALHPQIRMAGELLAKDQHTRDISWEKVNPVSWPQPRGDGYQPGENAAAFISQRVFSSTPFDNILAFGFKIFYDHARSDSAMRSIWPYLIDNPIRVIHIKRRNLFASYVSNEVAQITNEWHVLSGSRMPPSQPVRPLDIDPSLLQRYFEEILQSRDWAARTFADHPLIEVSYEDDLCGNFEATASRAFQFLGVMPWISRPALQKQQTIPLNIQVSNYSALKKHFQTSPYSEFFTEDDPEVGGFLGALLRIKTASGSFRVVNPNSQD